MNTLQHEEDNVAFKFLEIFLKKSITVFLHRWINDINNGQNKAINAIHLCWKPLKSNFQNLFLIAGKIFNYF